ncbi:MAG: delta 1-pyrroline-5-carboxylate synthetase [archaeon]|nr:delta 1-pyrroline-5-carboxylate synthetase [archaeon]
MVSVIKIGGSLAEDRSSLVRLCQKLVFLSKKHEVTIVPGGGGFADTVRYFYDKFRLSDDIAHKMAILAMDQYGLLLKDIMGEAILAYDLDDALQYKRGLSIILPSKIMFSLDPLEHSWNVTSDSISAFIASSLKAEKLILAKDVDGIFTSDPMKDSKAKIFKRISAKNLLKENMKSCIDGFLPRILIEKQLTCYVVSGKHPERIESVLEGRRDLYTEITPYPSRALL